MDFYNLDLISKREVIDKALKHKLRLKPKVGLSKKIKFGIEIEALGTDFIRKLRNKKNIYFYKHDPVYKPSSIYESGKWILYREETLFDEDGNDVECLFNVLTNLFFNDGISYGELMDLKQSLYNGGEVVSPILKDNFLCWNSVRKMINYMKDNISDLRVNDSCSCHTHFDVEIFENDPEILYNFIILLAENEDVLTRFYSGEYINIREIAEVWARPIKPVVELALNFEMNISSFRSLIESIYLGSPDMKSYSFDFWELYSHFYGSLSTTFENRIPNGTLSLPIIQNNVMLMGFLMEYVASGKYDVEKGKYRLINNVSDPLYLADMLPNEEAKLDFLSQYYKDGNVTNSEKLVKSKRIFY